MPTLYTPSLNGTEDFPTDGDRLIRVVEKYWRVPDTGKLVKLYDWQKWWLRHVLELYPDDWPVVELRGKLRYRQLVTSLGRQNGKSLLGSILGFYGLVMMAKGPVVLSLAHTLEGANIIYDRVKYAINSNARLGKGIKATGTRGIQKTDGSGIYKVKPAKEEALQGIPIDLCLFDEVHICPPEMWNAVVNGMRSKAQAVVCGITTAGDENSELLHALYETGRQAATGDPRYERFGFFLWEAPEGASTDDPEAIKAANPTVACGAIPVQRVIDDTRSEPEHKNRRFVLNQFVTSEGSWLPMTFWRHAPTGSIPAGARVSFFIDRTASWEYAYVRAAAKVGDVIYVETVATLVKPSREGLLRLCQLLWKHAPISFVLDGHMLRDLGDQLKQHGYPVKVLKAGDMMNAAATSYALLAQGKVVHDHDPLVTYQMPKAMRKNIGETWAVTRKGGTVEIDGVMATIMAIYIAATESEVRMM
ncbi:terminase large subunit [Streptomyces turgidiscabies]|uniref:terminase large subunit domain-containing protein n=1 Tax=Streptomyces TaxID=1883 RepID=UPI001319FB2C|nr:MULTISPECIES: terminase large subunit [Streptomyces]MDX3498594.1 terminase large subunit [Streptomyces turgidiscabies]